jgi:hypothetical protein
VIERVHFALGAVDYWIGEQQIYVETRMCRFGKITFDFWPTNHLFVVKLMSCFSALFPFTAVNFCGLVNPIWKTSVIF